jgi:hypothetical protein
VDAGVGDDVGDHFGDHVGDEFGDEPGPRSMRWRTLAALGLLLAVLALHGLGLDIWQATSARARQAGPEPAVWQVSFGAALLPRPSTPDAPFRPDVSPVMPVSPVSPAFRASPSRLPADIAAPAAPAAASAPGLAGLADATAPAMAAADATAWAQLHQPVPTLEPQPDPNATPFDWPPSARLVYELTGEFRGPVHGQATVLWLRHGGAYQMSMEVSVGPALAPFLARRMASHGQLGPEGLRPERYSERTRLGLAPAQPLDVHFEPAGAVRLASGQRVLAPPGVQDSASQFVQMSYVFLRQPGRLVPGQSLTLPLALPHRVDPWVYEVRGQDTLVVPAGEFQVLHVAPRWQQVPPGALVAEFWVAPALSSLPVRFLIREGPERWVELRLARLPELAVVLPGSSSADASVHENATTNPARPTER